MIQHAPKYKELAKKHDLPLEVIQKICESQFDFTKRIIAKGEDEKVYLQYLGTFWVHPRRRENLKKKKELAKKALDERNRQKEQRGGV